MASPARPAAFPRDEQPSVVAFPFAACGATHGPVHFSATAVRPARERHATPSLLAPLRQILADGNIHTLFQPILSLGEGGIVGYEALSRGPSDSPLHSPVALLRAAREHGLAGEVERLCCRVALETFSRCDLPGQLFLNISPDCLLAPGSDHLPTLDFIRALGLHPDRVIIELTESQPTYDYDLLREAVTYYREQGLRVAIDDLGEGFSSLRLWSELRPDFVKIDMHFVQDIQHDPVKLQFVRSIQEIAAESGTAVIAEGIENESELLVLRDLGIRFGQGYHIARPSQNPPRTAPSTVTRALHGAAISVYPTRLRPRATVTAARLLRTVQSVSPEHSNNHLCEMFQNDDSLQTIPVLNRGMPVGLVARHKLIDLFARPYLRELYGKKPCTLFMDGSPVVVDHSTSLQELSQRILAGGQQHLLNGFVITENGQYAGMGTGHDLMRELTQLQINAARYANPLTMLPGNVPIDEHIDRLIENGASFRACHVDLDAFKPFNDVYGYRRGDDIIQLTGRLLGEHVNAEKDFVGHIGGDDFILLMQSEDWEARCSTLLDAFGKAIVHYFPADARERGGYFAEDRRGNREFFPFVSLSIGVVKVAGGQYRSHHEIAGAAAEAKRQAKKIPGNSLFIERRSAGTLPAS